MTANGIVTSTNGAWSTVTNIFTATGGTPFSGVTIGDMCSLMADGGTIAVYTAEVSAIGGGGLTLTLNAAKSSGTAPTTSGTAITATTGGAWKGPNGTINFPFGYVKGTMQNAAGNPVRVNLKNNSTYSVTAAVTHNLAGSVVFQGYTSSAGDGGKFILDGGTSGSSYDLLTISNGPVQLIDAIIQNNGASGSASGLVLSGNASSVGRFVVNSVRGHGVTSSGAFSELWEGEVYAANQSNTSGKVGVFISTGANPCSAIRVIAHDNTGSNTDGFFLSGYGAILIGCIADTNGRDGFSIGDQFGAKLYSCDSYANVRDGFRIAIVSTPYVIGIENCNFVKNGTGGGGWGINITGSSAQAVGAIRNCGFGTGTQANTSGTYTNLNAVQVIGEVDYASGVTPWVDPANGDFRINLAAAAETGRGAFTETAASYAGTVGFPCVGSAQPSFPSGGRGGIKTGGGM